MTSYERFGAGVEHDLILLFKGFPTGADAAPYLERAGAFAPQCLHVTDAGFDITAYLTAANSLPHRRLCFLNSFSEVGVGGWLEVLHRALDGGRHGAAGATGSWGSHLSYHLFQLGLPGRYSESFESRRSTRDALRELSGATDRGDVLYWLWTAKMSVHYLRTGTLFPTTHLRTNGFLIEAALFRSLRSGRVKSKEAAYRLESGRRSMTAQLCALGRPPVVVNRHGAVFQRPDWHASDVFWQEQQKDLLIADNQTRSYTFGTSHQRDVLSRFAWGSHARPGDTVG